MFMAQKDFCRTVHSRPHMHEVVVQPTTDNASYLGAQISYGPEVGPETAGRLDIQIWQTGKFVLQHWRK